MPGTLGRQIRRVFSFVVAGLLVVACLLYIGDYARLRYKVARNSQPYGSVQVQSYYAVKLKDGKTEYFFNPPQMQQCSNTVFPQMGYTPCWYLKRKANKGTNL